KLQFTYMTTKMQAKVVKHGFDYVTTYNSGIQKIWTNPPNPCDPLVQGGKASGCTIGVNLVTVPIPLDPNVFGVGSLPASHLGAAPVQDYNFKLWNVAPGSVTAAIVPYSPKAQQGDYPGTT